MKLKILHVAPTVFPSNQGTQVYIEGICLNQVLRGHEVYLLTYHHGMRKGKGDGEFGFRVCRIADFPRFRSLRSGPSIRKVILDVIMIKQLRKIALEIEPDVVHLHNYEGLGVGVVALMGLFPLVYHAHTLMGHELPSYFNSKLMRFLSALSGGWLDRFLPPFASHTIAISPFLMKFLVSRGLNERKISYIPPSVDFSSGRVNNGKVNKDDADFVYMGNLDAYQGIDEMLFYFSRLLKLVPSLKLKIVSASDFSSVKSFVKEFSIGDSVLMVPHGDFSHALIEASSAQIALVPRKIPGGFPIKLLNYLLMSIPVMATPPGAVELKHRKEAMIYNCVDGFISSSVELLENENLRDGLCTEGMRYVKSRCSWDRTLGLIDGVYKKVIDCFRRDGF